jgi:hypothetical protein
MIRVFISSPYTLGDMALNVKKSIDAANELMTRGFAPYCPLLSHFQHIFHPREYEEWMQLDLEWLSVSNCILRLPGESSGADREVDKAKLLCLPIFYSFEELYRHYKQTN